MATFTPQVEKAVNYNVVCRVANKATPLTLNVKGEGYALRSGLLLEVADGALVELAPQGDNAVDFGQVRLRSGWSQAAIVWHAVACWSNPSLQVLYVQLGAPTLLHSPSYSQVIINDRAVRALHLVNSSVVNFDFAWDLGPNPRLSLKPERGVVPQGERVVCKLAYLPHAPDSLCGYKVACQVRHALWHGCLLHSQVIRSARMCPPGSLCLSIRSCVEPCIQQKASQPTRLWPRAPTPIQVVNGPKYQLVLHGTGYRPRLNLSFHSHDFGPVHVWRPGMEAAVAVLRAKNDDAQPVSFEVLWGDREHLAVSERQHVWTLRVGLKVCLTTTSGTLVPLLACGATIPARHPAPSVLMHQRLIFHPPPGGLRVSGDAARREP